MKSPNDAKDLLFNPSPHSTVQSKFRMNRESVLWHRGEMNIKSQTGNRKRLRNVNIMIQRHDAICGFDVVFVALFFSCSVPRSFSCRAHRSAHRENEKDIQISLHKYLHNAKWFAVAVCARERSAQKSRALFISDSFSVFFLLTLEKIWDFSLFRFSFS